ncbi:hypothetical protein HanRHA438_Chr03g0099691 [Helianthus annuus]|nr:hypothetical protein HanIR_Chr12g0612761 [Helianthus annuus]KAJ0933752.1 hypothetical protein HanRHA438_Chr03g0099691 [Helianthus annuus]
MNGSCGLCLLKRKTNSVSVNPIYSPETYWNGPIGSPKLLITLSILNKSTPK